MYRIRGSTFSFSPASTNSTSGSFSNSSNSFVLVTVRTSAFWSTRKSVSRVDASESFNFSLLLAWCSRRLNVSDPLVYLTMYRCLVLASSGVILLLTGVSKCMVSSQEPSLKTLSICCRNGSAWT